jgi:hypothetical protein
MSFEISHSGFATMPSPRYSRAGSHCQARLSGTGVASPALVARCRRLGYRHALAWLQDPLTAATLFSKAQVRLPSCCPRLGRAALRADSLMQRGVSRRDWCGSRC